MPIRNLHWYNQNEGIAYPVDEAASAVDDTDTALPSNILVDLHLRWPEHLGRYAFLSAVSVTPSLATITIQATDDLDSPGLTPLAVLTVVKPIEDGRVYPLRPQAAGVGGWAVFGSGVEDHEYAGRFSSPRQGRLAPRAARSYRPLPVKSASIEHASRKLTGVVTLRATLPLLMAKEEREIGGELHDCIVLRLTDVVGADGFVIPPEAAEISGFKETSTFLEFAGPCSSRPESGTCGTPQPIEFINAVSPDCDGVITLEFRGCATIARILDLCGIAIDCGLGMTDACQPPYIPDSEGRLPSEFAPVVIDPPLEPPPEPPPEGTSESLIEFGELPYKDCFFDGVADDFSIKSGMWQMVADDDTPGIVCADETYVVSQSLSQSFVSLSLGRFLGSLGTATASTRNVIVWEGFDDSATNRRVQTDVKMLPGPSGAKHNAAIVMNWKPHPSDSNRSVYFVAEIDYDNQLFRVARFNGINFIPIVPVSVPGLTLDEWYRIEVKVTPTSPGQTLIQARLTSVLSPETIDVTISVVVNTYAPSDGRFGFGSTRSLARFGYFLIEEYT